LARASEYVHVVDEMTGEITEDLKEETEKFKNITEEMSPEMEKKYGTIVKQVLKEINVHTSHLN